MIPLVIVAMHHSNFISNNKDFHSNSNNNYVVVLQYLHLFKVNNSKNIYNKSLQLLLLRTLKNLIRAHLKLNRFKHSRRHIKIISLHRLSRNHRFSDNLTNSSRILFGIDSLAIRIVEHHHKNQSYQEEFLRKLLLMPVHYCSNDPL